MRKMKESGIDWIGAIPEDWSVVRLKHLAKQIIDGTHATPTYVNDGVPFLRVTDVTNAQDTYQPIDLDSVARIPLEEHNELIKRCKPEKGDLLVSKNGTIGIPKVVEWDWEFSIFVSLCLLKLKDTVSARFLMYYFKSPMIENEIAINGKTGTITNLHLEKIREFNIPYTSVERQKKIVDFLDDKCGKLDSIIDRQRQVVDKLNAYKLSVITEAVTKGLNSDIPMKDSGIAWVGKIPEYATVTRVGHLYKSILGKMLSSVPNSDDDTLEDYFCAVNVHFDGVDYENIKQMWFSPKEKETYIVHKEDLLVVEGGAGAGGASVVDRDVDNCYVQNSIHIVRPTSEKVNAKFLYYTLYSLVKRNYIDFVCNKATIPHFTKDKLLGVPVVVLENVDAITDYLDKKCAAIDSSIIRLQYQKAKT